MSFAEAYGADKPVSSLHGTKKRRGGHGGMRRSFHHNDQMTARLPQMPGKTIDQADQVPPVHEYEDRPTRFAIQ